MHLNTSKQNRCSTNTAEKIKVVHLCRVLTMNGTCRREVALGESRVSVEARTSLDATVEFINTVPQPPASFPQGQN